MIDTIRKLFGKKTTTATTSPVAAPLEFTRSHAIEPREQHGGFAKIFRWPVPPDQNPGPTIVEVAGSFTNWQRVPLAYDNVMRTWTATLRDIQGNHTHRYVMFVNGVPSYDKTCDGLAVPQGPDEERCQIATARGPRVMLMFAQTR